MALTIYGPGARVFVESFKPWRPQGLCLEELHPVDEEQLPEEVGVEIDEHFGPIVHCAGDGCTSRVRFDWRHERQLCDACGGPPIVHAPLCDVTEFGPHAECDCGAR